MRSEEIEGRAGGYVRRVCGEEGGVEIYGNSYSEQGKALYLGGVRTVGKFGKDFVSAYILLGFFLFYGALMFYKITVS